MEMKRQALDQLSEIGQDVGQLLDNPKTSKKINRDSEELTQRWDSLVQRLEDSSNQVPMLWEYFVPLSRNYTFSFVLVLV